MNAGRLHAVLELIKQDYEKHEVVARLQAASNALATSIRTVNEDTAVAFRDAIGDLYKALEQSPLTSATPSELETLKEIGAHDKVGAGLRGEIENTLNSNTVTPANALAELQRIAEVISHFNDVVTQIIGGFEELKIPYEALQPGESEIGATIPWQVVETNLEGLQKNLQQYDRSLKAFGELADDRPDSPAVRSVGSSAFQIFLESTPGIALCIATAIERLCALYKQILEIRVLRKKVKEQSLPEEVSASIGAYEQVVAKSGIEKIADDLIKEFGKNRPKERLNELRTALAKALKFLATQIDQGVDLEVRSEPPRPKDVAQSEGQSVKSDKTKKALEGARQISDRVKRAGAAMKALRRADEPVLALEFVEKQTKQTK